MEQPSSSSKVTVEYFDPYGLYQLLSPGLLRRLPLRNLHWESHAGPLRSISSLHIDLLQSAQEALVAADTTSAKTSFPQVKSEDSKVIGDDGFRVQTLSQAIERRESQSGPPKLSVKERRHQIPGLRQTPYLKLLFLRCDDNDTYKAQARRQVRDWIKEHTPPAQSTTKLGTQENHDAFEWMVVHVVIPNTAAATQPRTSGKQSEGSNGSGTEKLGPRWRGGGSSTILEKLRADFNGSSKSAVDRIAQIRIGINDVPYEILPRVVPVIPGNYTESPQENENAWQDLISKLKSLILASFDMRVSQYEEDIREKDAQRSLPGWNFCTFFVLKEGLARGFESVGLVEDSLVGYDELAVGLDAIIREKSIAGSGAEHGGSFLPFTDDLKRQVDSARASLLMDMGSSDFIETEEPINLQCGLDVLDNEASEIPLSSTKKRYRELILANNISVFDFRCYLFARQLSLLLRLGNATVSKQELLSKLKEQRESSLQGVAARLPTSQVSDETENLAVLGEVCRRTMYFISSIVRIMQADMWGSQTQNKTLSGSAAGNTQSLLHPVISQVIDNIVSSFTFATSQQILAQTSTKALPIPPSKLVSSSSETWLDGKESKAVIPEPTTMMHPARSSSLAVRAKRETTSPDVFSGGRGAGIPEQDAATPSFLKMGLEELAAQRAELYLLSRNVLQRVGTERGWSVGWSDMANLLSGSEMEDVDLSQASPEKSKSTRDLTVVPPSSYGINSKLLRTALDNKEDFYRLYETLTDKALRHYTVANHTQSVQSCMTDLAVLKYYLSDYAAAASYFHRTTPFYGDGGWTNVELSMLVIYAKCLKQLQRKEEYVRVVLKLLSKVAIAENERLQHKSLLKLGPKKVTENFILLQETFLPELFEITKQLSNPISIPLVSFFGRVDVDGTVRYHPEKDSIGIHIRLLYLLEDNLNIDKARVRIGPVTEDAGRDTWFESEGPLIFKKGMVTLPVQSNTIAPGTYIVNHIIFSTNNLDLRFDYSSSGTSESKNNAFFNCPKFLIYHRSEAFDVKLHSSRYMHLDRNRSLELELFSGWNNVLSGEIRIRAATAGLRLQTSESRVVTESIKLSKKLEAGVLCFGALAPYSTARILIPFTLEHEVKELSVKVEVAYNTEKGNFVCASAASISTMLPLGVNVQDSFKHKAVFSKFSISSSTNSPLRLLSSRLEGSEIFQSHGGVQIGRPLVIFPSQPALILYKITKKKSSSQTAAGARKNSQSLLSLVLTYACLEEEIEATLRSNLEAALKDSPLLPYKRLIVSTVVAELRTLLSPYELERIALLGEIPSSLLTSVRWREHFMGLGYSSTREVAILLEEFLHAWSKQKPAIDLVIAYDEEESSVNSRSIMIPVDVPSVTVVHTADLKLCQLTIPSATGTAIAAANQPISALLVIKWTRIWDREMMYLSENPAANSEEFLQFYYEILAAPDTWLLGGRRKGHFQVPQSRASSHSTTELSFPIVLIPLREGILPFPAIDIKPSPSPLIPTSPTNHHRPPAVSFTCETDYLNAAEVIRIISDVRKTTVSLDASGPQGGALLLGTER